MANICYYKIKANGKKTECQKLIDMMPLYSGEKEIIKEEGDKDNYSLTFTGSCKWDVDAYTEKHNNLKQLSEEDIINIKDGDYWDYPIVEKSILLNLDILCNTLDEEEESLFLHYNKGKKINDTCPEELEMNYESLFEEDDYDDNFSEEISLDDFVITEDKEYHEVLLLDCTNENIDEMVIPDKVTWINEAFGCCLNNLVKIIIPKSVSTIDFSCFTDNPNLEIVEIYGNPDISEDSFTECPKIIIKANKNATKVIEYCKESGLKFEEL